MTKPLDVSPAGFIGMEDEDTIELELSAEQVLALSRAAAVSQSNPVPVRSAEESLPKVSPLTQGKAPEGDTPPKGPRGARGAVVVSIAAASVLLAGVAYLATTRAQPVHVAADIVSGSAAPPETPAPPSVDNTPVRFTNPFDATEVFEFSSGTSETEARDAVADLLLQRARERKNRSPKTTREGRKTVDQATPVTATGLDRRS
jgi:hypothetical protein